MKKLSFLLVSILLTSCSVSNYYQVYKANFENGTILNGKIIFEDKNCSVSYDLWGKGGNIGFVIYNKTDNDLTVDLSKTYFVLNGLAYEYYQNRTYTNSASIGTTVTTYPYYYYWYAQPSKVSGTDVAGYSISFAEKSELTIPSKTQINISEYRISNSRYVNCDLLKYPSKKDAKTLNFEKSNSPFVFYNLISYKTKDDSTRMENKFYVSEITNLPSTEMFTMNKTGECGKKLEVAEKVFKKGSPDKFYIKYTKEVK